MLKGIERRPLGTKQQKGNPDAGQAGGSEHHGIGRGNGGCGADTPVAVGCGKVGSGGKSPHALPCPRRAVGIGVFFLSGAVDGPTGRVQPRSGDEHGCRASGADAKDADAIGIDERCRLGIG